MPPSCVDAVGERTHGDVENVFRTDDLGSVHGNRQRQSPDNTRMPRLGLLAMISPAVAPVLPAIQSAADLRPIGLGRYRPPNAPIL